MYLSFLEPNELGGRGKRREWSQEEGGTGTLEPSLLHLHMPYRIMPNIKHQRVGVGELGESKFAAFTKFGIFKKVLLKFFQNYYIQLLSYFH